MLENDTLIAVVKCLFRQLLDGLDHLHKNDIIHRYVHN